ncbi:penicillin-binding protein 2 [bacterium]|nr:penicillin-binding protein 2 [bacterium]
MFEIGRDVCRHTFGVSTSAGRRRLRIVYVLFVIAFAIFIVRTLQLGIHGTNRSRRAGADAGWAVSRADIVDRNGDILAKNVMSGDIILRNKIVKNRDAVAALIHEIAPNEYSLANALALVNSNRSWVRIKKSASDAERAKVKQAKLQGLDVDEKQVRRYPKRRLFSHIVGFVDVDGRGMDGAERQYDEYLRENNDALQLSLDSRVQSVFYEQLSAAVHRYQAKGAMGMLMNSRTGEMVAMVSLPDFDPENRSADPVGNRTFMPMRGVFEMGSVFKIFNTAMAYENGITKEYKVDAPFKIYDKNGRLACKPIDDVSSFRPSRPYFGVDEIMIHSSNRGSAQIALDLPIGAQKEFFQRLKFDKPLNLEFGRTERGLITQHWGPVERATMSFGHGISVTPMHLLLAVNAMTNGGIYIYPTLQKRNVGVVRGERVLDDKISAKLRHNMLRVAEETSGKKARVAGIEIGGKTGTAEKRDGKNIDRKRNLTVFAGVFPASAPQYTLLVVLDEPKGIAETYGLRTAAWNVVPTAGKILDNILPLLFE